MDLFTIFFIFFMAFMAAQRFWETFIRGRTSKVKGHIEKGFILNILIFFHVTGLFSSFIEYFFVSRERNMTVTCIGLSLYVVALIGRNWSIRELGQLHSIHIEIRDSHKLISRGLYNYLRHPIYFFTIIELISIPLISNSYYSLIFPIFCYIPTLLLRIHYEEKALISKFGEDYLLYKQKCYGLLPLKKKNSVRHMSV